MGPSPRRHFENLTGSVADDFSANAMAAVLSLGGAFPSLASTDAWTVNDCMKRRTATVIVCIVDAAAWVFVAFATFLSGSDAATKGLDEGAGLVVTALYFVTGAPALALTLLGRAPAMALTLALAFPAALAALFVAAIMAFA